MSTKSRKKKSRAYRRKIVTVTILGILLAVASCMMCLLLFTDIIFSRNTEQDETEPASIIADVSGGISSDEITKIYVTYDGGPVYAGGQAVADYFTVKAQHSDGSEEIVTDYDCRQLSDDYRLSEGENTFEFEYHGKMATIDLNAKDIRTLPYPPDYVTHYVDKEAAEDKAQKLRNGEITFDEAFADVAFTGDSQIVGLISYGLLGEERIVAKIGESYDWFDANFDRVVMAASNCETIVVHYGINTLSSSADERRARIEQYKELLVRLKEALPHLRIIVSGVFPVSFSIFGSQDRFKYISDYDYDLVDMCMEIGVEYLSDNEYMLQHSEVFGQDGLHLTGDFYRNYWMENIIEVMGI